MVCIGMPWCVLVFTMVQIVHHGKYCDIVYHGVYWCTMVYHGAQCSRWITFVNDMVNTEVHYDVSLRPLIRSLNF